MTAFTRELTRPRPEFVTLIAIYQFTTAAILFLLGCLMTVFGIPLLFFTVREPGTLPAALIGATILALAIAFGVASLVVGWGLLQMRDWARLGAIVLAAFALIGFPIWTIVAILVLLYLTSADARAAFGPAELEGDQEAVGEPTHDPAINAAYKTEPAAKGTTDPTQETREMRPADTLGTSNGSEGTATEETRRIDQPIAMPPGEPLQTKDEDMNEKRDTKEPNQENVDRPGWNRDRQTSSEDGGAVISEDDEPIQPQVGEDAASDSEAAKDEQHPRYPANTDRDKRDRGQSV